MKTINAVVLVLICIMLVSCASAPQIQTVVVTQEVTREVPIEVTRAVEVTRIVEQEVTRIVAPPPTATPNPADPDVAFSLNYLGTLDHDNVKVELPRVVFMKKSASANNFDDFDVFKDQDYVGQIIWRVTNNTSVNIEWNYDDINARVNDRQITLYDYLFHGFGSSLGDEIFPGSTIVGGVWFGIGSVKPSDITSVSFLLPRPFNADTYHSVTSQNFVITADLSGPHQWFDLPDELK